jgi:hypothetical protein
VYLSPDSGKNWTLVSTGLGNQQVYALAFNGVNLFAGTYGGGVFRSTNAGTSWTHLTGTNANILSLAVMGKSLFAGTYGGGVYYSADSGKSWAQAGLATAIVRALAVSGARLFAGISSGVYLSTNNGASWSANNTALTDTNVNALGVNGTNLFAGTGAGGVWRRPLAELLVSVQTPSEGTPSGFVLSQNYPNPFNPTTIITYQTPVAGSVRLVVYDMLGREVTVLVNDNKDPGVYEVKFNASNLSSGVYLYRMQSGTFTETRKFLLVR